MLQREAEAFPPALQRRERALVVHQCGHVFQLGAGFAVILHHAVRTHVDNQHELLPQMVVGDHLVEQQQVEVLPRAAPDAQA